MPVYRTVEQCTVMRDQWADQALQWLQVLEEEGASNTHRFWKHFEGCIYKIWEWNGRIEAQKFRDDRLGEEQDWILYSDV